MNCKERKELNKKKNEEKNEKLKHDKLIKDYEEVFLHYNLELSKKIFRYILDNLPKQENYDKMTYQDKYLIVRNNAEFTEFVDKFPIVVREMFIRNYNEKAFKKFARYIYNYVVTPEERVLLNSGNKMQKMEVLNRKNSYYVFWLHYYMTNKKSKEASKEFYKNMIKELNKDSEKYYGDYIELLERSKRREEEIKNRYIEEITKNLNSIDKTNM